MKPMTLGELAQHIRQAILDTPSLAHMPVTLRVQLSPKEFIDAPVTYVGNVPIVRGGKQITEIGGKVQR